MPQPKRWMMTTATSVTLLFDPNLSPRLPRLLGDLFPESIHVGSVLELDSPDEEIWEYAREHGFVIVTKDRDFIRLSKDRGHPPKVIRVTLGNCPREAVANLLRENYAEIAALWQDDKLGRLKLP